MNILYFSMFLLFAMLVVICDKQTLYSSAANVYKKEVGLKRDIKIGISQQSVLIVLMIISFSFLCATRDINSYDTLPYIEYFNKMNRISFFDIEGTYGVGFEILTKILILFVHDNYQLYFGIISALNCLIVWIAFKKFNDVSQYRIVIYLGFLGIYYNFIVIRQGVAISFILLAYCNLLESKKKFILYSILAVLFHESAILVLIVFLIGHIFQLGKIQSYMMILISFILYITKLMNRLILPVLSLIYELLPSAFFHKYILYFDNVQYVYDISILHLVYYVLSFALVHIIWQTAKEYDVCKIFMLYNVMGLMLLGFFSSLPAIIRAVDYLSTATYVLLIPIIIKKFEKKSRIFVSIIFFLLLVIFYLRIILVKVGWFL